MPKKLSANMLYNYVKCPHRLTLDLFGDYSKQDPISVFVKLLWEKGTDFEKQVIKGLEIPFLDLRSYSGIEKEKRTKEAINDGVELIYSGRIIAGNLIGEPELLRRDGDGYISGDIKSGSGLEGENDLSEGKPKLHYTVQLALYTDILERLGISAGRNPFIWDIHGREIEYDLNSPQSTRNQKSWWSKYTSCLEEVSKIANHDLKTLPAYSGICKLCHWRTYCLRCLRKANDLTLIPELGRSKRDVMINHLGSVAELAQANLNQFQKGGKTIFPRVGRDTLEKFQKRAILLSKSGSKPYLKGQITLPDAPTELFFDIETPTNKTYQQTGNTPLSALSDLSIYRYINNGYEKLANVELKAHNPATKNISKDIEKIVREKKNGNWFHVLKNINKGTLTSVFDKFIFSLKEHSNKDSDISILFCICILEKKWGMIKHFKYDSSLGKGLPDFTEEFFCLSKISNSNNIRDKNVLKQKDILENNDWTIIEP